MINSSKIFVSLAVLASAWDDTIHSKIATIALKVMNEKMGKQIPLLIKGDLRDYAAYGHTHYNEEYPFTERLHFQPQDPEWTCSAAGAIMTPTESEEAKQKQLDNYRPCGKDGDSHCLLGLLYFIFNKFAHHELLEYEGAPPLPKVTDLQDLQGAMRMDLFDSHLLRWMVTLLGDLHQPLHFGFPSNNFGKDTMITFRDQKYLLYEFWEKILPATFDDYSNLKPSEDDLRPSPLTLFGGWAEESAKLVCNSIYGKMTTRGHSVQPKTFVVSEKLYREWKKIVADQLRKAGIRTAMFLENILEHRHHHHAAALGRGRHHPRAGWVKKAAINFCLALIALPIFFLGLVALERLATRGRMPPAGLNTKPSYSLRHEYEMVGAPASA